MKGFHSLLLLVVSLSFAVSYAAPIKVLDFYLHDKVDLTNPSNSTVVLVAGPKNLQFGAVLVIDDVLTKGPSRDSEIVGRAKGTYISDDSTNTTTGLFLTFVAVFKDGTMSMYGQDNIFDEVRELAVIGGTGAYRFASGYAQIRTYKIIPPLSAILKFHVFYKN
ncbi:dirigent protein 2 [Selaginella moellendorffii]|nr:dirigent protein 2 [Selaginella moellendorffii]|eukprot:XP_002971049.2 dirigent protein 2 [Selaginella moellendorffii]